MPYKDPDRKRQWEREHREERNARRRKSMSTRSPEDPGADAPLPNPNSAQVPLTGMNVAIGLMMGLAFLLIVLVAIWRFTGSYTSLATA